jgi:hypothetical protein
MADVETSDDNGCIEHRESPSYSQKLRKAAARA